VLWLSPGIKISISSDGHSTFVLSTIDVLTLLKTDTERISFKFFCILRQLIRMDVKALLVLTVPSLIA